MPRRRALRVWPRPVIRMPVDTDDGVDVALIRWMLPLYVEGRQSGKGRRAESATPP